MVVPTKRAAAAAATVAVAAAVCHVKVQSCAMQKCQFAFVVALWTVSSEGCNCSFPPSTPRLRAAAATVRRL